VPIINKPSMNDILIRVRIKLDIYGMAKFDNVQEVIAEAQNICSQIQRNVGGVYDASVCSDADGHLEELGEWNKASWFETENEKG
jgi:hypothetical protein